VAQLVVRRGVGKRRSKHLNHRPIVGMTTALLMLSIS
jgi:hypothetical protein